MARGRTKKKSMLPAIELVAPTDAQMTNGHYERAEIIHAESFARATVHINRGGSPVTRWEASGKLSETQVRAIDYCQRLWNIVGINPSVTAKYDHRLPASDVESETQVCRYLDAKDDLARVESYFTGLRPYWSVYEQVCRHGEAAGVAGSRLGYGDRSSEHRAHTIVCFVSDFIAMKEKL